MNLVLAALGGAQHVSQMDSCVEGATRISQGHSSTVKRFNAGNDYRYEMTLDGNVTIRTSRHTRKMGTTSPANMSMTGRSLSNRNSLKTLPVIFAAMRVVPYLAPAALLRRMLDSATSLELIPPSQTPAGTVGILMKKTSAITNQVEEQRWYFDSQTSLPISVTYWVPSVISLRNHGVLQAKFEQYGTLGGFLVPQLLTTSIGSMTLGVETINSLQCQQSIPTDLFTSPGVE
jgi:hypothetical protein